MNDRIAILESFTSQEMKEELAKLMDIIDDLAKRTPIVGIHHRFYVPGWIGFFQQVIVERKMDKIAEESFSCAGMNYYEFGDWIINKSVEIAEMQSKSLDTDPDVVSTQNEIINRIFTELTTIWAHVIPEISSYSNIQYTENSTISRHGFVLKGLEQTLEKLGRAKFRISRSDEPSFKEEAKQTGYWFAGYIINILLFAAIIGLLSLLGIID